MKLNYSACNISYKISYRSRRYGEIPCSVSRQLYPNKELKYKHILLPGDAGHNETADE